MGIRGDRDVLGSSGDEFIKRVRPDAPQSVDEVQERAYQMLEGLKEEVDRFRQRGNHSGARQLSNDIPVVRATVRRLGFKTDRDSE